MLLTCIHVDDVVIIKKVIWSAGLWISYLLLYVGKWENEEKEMQQFFLLFRCFTAKIEVKVVCDRIAVLCH